MRRHLRLGNRMRLTTTRCPQRITVQATGLIVARVYGHVLQSRLGKAGFKTYLANPWLHAAAVLVTFEVQAIALAAVVLA